MAVIYLEAREKTPLILSVYDLRTGEKKGFTKIIFLFLNIFSYEEQVRRNVLPRFSTMHANAYFLPVFTDGKGNLD